MTSFLYVEDDLLSREVIQIALVSVMGFDEVVIFEDSSDFQARVNGLECVPDVILLDIHVKPFNGFEMLDMLREDERFAQSRIIALTASVMNEEVVMLKNSGFDGGISKPIDPEIFPDLLQRIIDGEIVWHIGK